MALRTPQSWAAAPPLYARPLADIAAQAEVEAPAANEKVRAALGHLADGIAQFAVHLQADSRGRGFLNLPLQSMAHAMGYSLPPLPGFRVLVPAPG